MVQKKDTGEKPKIEYFFHGQSTRSKYWFDLGIQWVEEKFSKREPQFYKSLFQINIEVQAEIIYHIFSVTIGNAKETGELEYNIQAPLVAYHHNASNSCCFSSLASEFTASGENNSARAIGIRIEE